MKNRGQEVDNKGKVRPIQNRESKKMMFLMERGRRKTKTNSQRKSCRTSKTFRRKIDANSEIVKAKLKAFTDMFPSADIT
jgi:hypothetical protein